jgi:hypothetical protein
MSGGAYSYEQGKNDCIKGIKPQCNFGEYIKGYADQYAKEQQKSQQGFN